MFSSSRSIHSGARLVRGVRAPLIVSCSSLSEVTPAPIVMTDRTNVRVFLGGGISIRKFVPVRGSAAHVSPLADS